MVPHEEAFIKAFLIRAYRDRCLAKKGLPREDLWHLLPSRLDRGYTCWLPDNIHTPKRIQNVISRLTQAKHGHCISVDEESDGAVVSIAAIGDREGTIISFIPGKLAFYQAEYAIPTPRCLLVRHHGLKAKATRVIHQVSEYYKEHNTDLS